jgi:hypothetical protein
MANNVDDQQKCEPGLEGCTGDPQTCKRHPAECLAYRKMIERGETHRMEECMGKSMEQLSRAFTASARRWELIVYPSLFAFILLAAYGFYLIYSLTADVHRVVDNMESITANMQKVAINMQSVSTNMVVMTQTVADQSTSMREMVINMRQMNSSIGRMRYDLAVMNNSVSRPMSFMNSFMPW